MAEEELRGRILSQVAEYYEKVHARRKFEPGITKVHYAGRVFDAEAMISTDSVSLLTATTFCAGRASDRRTETMSLRWLQFRR